MATQEQGQSLSRPTQVEKVPQLTAAYQKTHKNYVLASGLLASWELIGIDPDFERFGLKPNPNHDPNLAVLLILCTLVLYLGYKLTIEWLQCDEKRRAVTVSKIDYRIAHTIACIAMTITIDQHALHLRFVNQIDSWLMINSLIVCLMPTLSWFTYVNLARVQRLTARMPSMLGAFLALSPVIPYLIGLAIAIHGIVILLTQKRMVNIQAFSTMMIGCVVGGSISWGLVALQRKLFPSSSENSSPPPEPPSYLEAAAGEW